MSYPPLIEWFINDLLREKRERRPYELWVTDLISCSNKYNLSLRYPEYARLTALKPPILNGTLIHQGFEAIIKEMGLGIIEKELSMNVNVDNVRYMIVGRVDIIYDNDLYELKTISIIPDSVLEHHKDQVNIYRKLCEENGIEIRHAYVVYISPRDGIKCYPVEKADVDISWRVKTIVHNTAIPMYDWECGYCIWGELGFCNEGGRKGG